MTVREYDAKEKERLYGISRQTPSVLSLVIIFFVALSAQASAQTTLKCEVEGAEHREGLLPIKEKTAYDYVPGTYTITFEGDRNGDFKTLSHDIPDCGNLFTQFLREKKVLFTCETTDQRFANLKLIEINRITGVFSIKHDYLRYYKGYAGVRIYGSCKKVKKKF